MYVHNVPAGAVVRIVSVYKTSDWKPIEKKLLETIAEVVNEGRVNSGDKLLKFRELPFSAQDINLCGTQNCIRAKDTAYITCEVEILSDPDGNY